MKTENRKPKTENRQQYKEQRDIIVKDLSPALKLKTSKNNDKTKWQSYAR
jgi:hypothetical protein